ncbi:hypothetical protein D3C80_1571970 [compost metagenome]
MTGQHAFGAAGGPGGVENQRRGVGLNVQRCDRQGLGGQQILVSQALLGQRAFGCPPYHDAGAFADGQIILQHCQAGLVTQQQARTAVLDAM